MAVPGDPDPVSDVLDSAEAGGRAIRGAGMRVGGYVLSLTIALVAVPFMIRHLGAVDYGYYVTVSSIVFIIGGLTEAGLTALGVREYSTLEGDARQHFQRSLIGLRLVLTAVGVVLAAAITWVTGADREVVTLEDPAALPGGGISRATFGEVGHRVDRLAHALKALGLQEVAFGFGGPDEMLSTQVQRRLFDGVSLSYWKNLAGGQEDDEWKLTYDISRRLRLTYGESRFRARTIGFEGAISF